MLAHVVMWKIKEEFKKDEKNIKDTIKKEIEALAGKIEGLEKIVVYTDKVDSSTHDLILYSELKDEESLKSYATHEAHVHVGKTYIVPYVTDRVCIDYFI